MSTNLKISEQKNPKCERKVGSRDEWVAARLGHCDCHRREETSPPDPQSSRGSLA